MTERVFNFNPGPATLPESVLDQTAQAVLRTRNGMSIIEVSHRSAEYEDIHFSAQRSILELMELPPEEYDVLFLQGGASQQFAMIPMNFLGRHHNHRGDYVDTGYWSKRAIDEARVFNDVNVAASSEDAGYSFIPKELHLNPDARYIHITTNNTIEGTQWVDLPETKGVPLVADASSDFLALKRDYSRFALIYTGAQKNIGPAGITIVVVSKSFLETAVVGGIPKIFSYKTHAESKSLYNTPPVFGVYVVSRMLEWIEEQGGLSVIEANNRRKAQSIYDAIDKFPDIYEPAVRERQDRSIVNATFRLRNGLEEEFLAGVEERQMIGLAGHRSIGGIRVSLYNGLPLDWAQALADFIENFAKRKLR